VAVRWRWLELARLLGRPDVAERYVRRALVRRSYRWRPDPVPAADGEDRAVDIIVWAPEVYQPTFGRRPRQWTSSGATRLAPYLKPLPRNESSVLADAAVAWWHAYEAKRRQRYIALIVGLFVLGVLLAGAASGNG
jgi:hypothetical protein